MFLLLVILMDYTKVHPLVSNIISLTCCTGNYTIIVTDANSCSAQQVVVVKLYTNDIEALAYSHPVYCYGYLLPKQFSLPPKHSCNFTFIEFTGNTGSISISATGTYPPFQYQVCYALFYDQTTC